MICPICKTREATFHLTDHSKKQKSFHICEECKKTFSLSHLLCEDLEKLKQQFAPETASKSKNQLALVKKSDIENFVDTVTDIEGKLTCEKCGNSLSNIIKKGILGCEHEYVTFAKFIEKALLNSQGSALHKGKKLLLSDTELQISKLHSLEFNLKKAIENENYELAGKLSKEINDLKKS